MSVDPADLRTHNEWPPGSLLSRLDDSTRQALLTAGTCRRVGSSTVLMRQGENGNHVILLRRSLVKVTVPTADGREALLDIRVSGDLVGEIGALNDRPRSASGSSRRGGNATFNVIPRAELRALLAQYPEVAIHLAGVVAERLCWANRRRLDFTAYPVKIRLARALAELAATYGRATSQGLEIDVELTQPEAATLVGASEISVQRASGK